jgi:hypothetical protein
LDTHSVTELIVGMFALVFGGFILLQARLPKERRTVRFGRSGRGPILGASQCIRVGSIFATLGIFMAFEGAKIIHISAVHVIWAVVLCAIGIVASMFVADDSDDIARPSSRR